MPPRFSVLRGRGSEYRGMPTSKLARFIALFGGGLLAVLLLMFSVGSQFRYLTGGNHPGEIVLTAGSDRAYHSHGYYYEDGPVYLKIELENVTITNF